ncbi:MAG: excisionase [Prevotella sp.]|nr:excisionase [Prevotella sp.]
MNSNETTISKPKLLPGDKYTLTLREASEYFNIGDKKIRRLAEDHRGEFALYSGNKYLIIRHKFEKFLDETEMI